MVRHESLARRKSMHDDPDHGGVQRKSFVIFYKLLLLFTRKTFLILYGCAGDHDHNAFWSTSNLVLLFSDLRRNRFVLQPDFQRVFDHHYGFYLF